MYFPEHGVPYMTMMTTMMMITHPYPTAVLLPVPKKIEAPLPSPLSNCRTSAGPTGIGIDTDIDRYPSASAIAPKKRRKKENEKGDENEKGVTSFPHQNPHLPISTFVPLQSIEEPRSLTR